jgi:hypothetical protein
MVKEEGKMKGLLRILIASFITLLLVSTAHAGPLEKITKTIASKVISETLGIHPAIGVIKTAIERLSPKEQMNAAVNMEVTKKMVEHLESTGKLGNLKISKSQLLIYILSQSTIGEAIVEASLGGRKDEVVKEALEKLSQVSASELNSIQKLYQKWSQVQLGMEEVKDGIKGMIKDPNTLTIEATNTGYTVVTEKMKGLGRQIEIEKIDKASAPSDASKVKEGTPHQLVTPVAVEFTQTFDGLFTQSANSPGSRDGRHSGTLTDGTRVNVKGDSVAGDFTGSFSGQTVAETGYTPATHTNSAFSGSSVGTASAKGLKEGNLKGTMTVTIPSGTQTTNVTGNITIKTDGSLSMPSYTGPTTDNATGTKVGTMSGSWSQSKTR